MPKYVFIDHTADVGIEAFGASLPELFSNAAFALFDIIADLEMVEIKVTCNLEITGIDREQLLVNWLSELLYLHDVKTYLFKNFLITNITDTHLSASVQGEPFVEDKHIIKPEIKAVTYHGLSIVQEGTQWKARVIFDL